MKRLLAVLLLLLTPVFAYGEPPADTGAYSDADERQVFMEKGTPKPTPRPTATPRPKKSPTPPVPQLDASKLEARYEAVMLKDSFLRRSAGGDRFERLPENTKVTVHEIGEVWSCVIFRKWAGYVETKNLARFRSLLPYEYAVPGRTVNSGILTLKKTARIKGDRFTGLDAPEGASICVTSADETACALAVWRGSGSLPSASGVYSAFVPWDEARPGDLIGGFTTYYNEKTGAPRAKERIHNITLACERIDGTELKPGRQFSFNKLCAPYSQNNRYLLANNISARGVGFGGGVCQLSTTLYNALLALPIQVDAVAVHRKSGVQYIPQWFDSAVGSYSDLKFTNTLPYPLRIWAQPQEGALTVLLYRAGD